MNTGKHTCEYCEIDDVAASIIKGSIKISNSMYNDLSLMDFDVYINPVIELELYVANCAGDPLFNSCKKINYCPMCGRRLSNGETEV